MNNKIKLAEYFINFTGSYVHKYNEVSGVKGDFKPMRFDEEKKLVTIDDDVLLSIAEGNISIDELMRALSETDIYCIANDIEVARKIFGENLGNVAIVTDTPTGRGGEEMVDLNWAMDDSFVVEFSSNKICV